MVAECRYCHRPLRTPASVAAGYGPVCAQRNGHRPTTHTRPRKAARTPVAARHEPTEQQLTLDLENPT